MSIGQIFFKKSSLFIEENTNLVLIQKYLLNYWFWLGISSFGIATLVWIKILSLAKLSTIYPMQSICYIVVAILAFFIFQEKLNALNIVGIFIIMLGVFLISQGK